MRIAIDAFGLRLNSGVRTYTEHLIKSLQVAEHDVTVIYASPEDQLETPYDHKIIGPRRKLFIPFRDNITVRRYLKREDFDVYHVTRSTGPVFEVNGVKMIRTIHDLCNRYTNKQRVDKLSKLYKV